MSRALPVTAPRGKAFAVAHFPLAIGANAALVSAVRWQSLADAEKARAAIDHRLTPFVIVADKALA